MSRNVQKDKFVSKLPMNVKEEKIKKLYEKLFYSMIEFMKKKVLNYYEY